MPVLRSLAIALPTAFVLAFLAGCSPSTTPSTDPVRLIDRMEEAKIEGSPEMVELKAHDANWAFVDGTQGWFAPHGVDNFRLEDNALKGTTSKPDVDVAPAAALVVPLPELPEDELWEIQVRARVSTGANLTARFGRGEDLVIPAVFGNPMGIFRTPIQAGEDMNDYTIRPSNPVMMGKDPGHLVITPSDVAGADFAIEKVSLVLRKQHLNSVASGPGWQGLGEIYKETIVSRSPETVSFEVELPASPFLELSVGTIEAGDTTFHVEVATSGQPALTWEKRVSEPNVWQSGQLDLAGVEGRTAMITMSIESSEDGTVGLWGAPAVRSATTDARVAEEGAAPVGVILILTDTLRRDHLDLYGYERGTAPNMSKMASEGVRFDDPISQATWTKVSVPAIQTGLYPMTHTIRSLPDRLPASATTMAEAFREAGYTTFGLTSIPFVGRMTNLHQGYETLHEPGAMGDAGDLENGGTVKSSFQLVPKLLDWLDQRDGSKFFALLHIADAHSPFRPTAEHELDFAAEGEMDRLDELTEQVRPHIKHPLMKNFGMPRREELVEGKVDADEFVRLETNGMDGSIKGMDGQIGRVFAKLDELGLRDKVLVALVADHGTELLEHDDHFHGHTLYGELNRVPMLLWGPGFVPSGVQVKPTVQTIDLMPTMLDVAGLPIPVETQGASLRALWENPDSARWRRPAFTEQPIDLRTGNAALSVISEGWKLVRKGEWEAEPNYELFNHVDDPINRRNVAEQNPEQVERLAKLLEGWRSKALAARLDDSAANATLDSAELERLRSMGYVQ